MLLPRPLKEPTNGRSALGKLGNGRRCSIYACASAHTFLALDNWFSVCSVYTPRLSKEGNKDFPNIDQYLVSDGTSKWNNISAHKINYQPMIAQELEASEALLSMQIDQNLLEPSLRSISLDLPTAVHDMRDRTSPSAMNLLLQDIGDRHQQQGIPSPSSPTAQQWTEQLAIAKAQARQWIVTGVEQESIPSQGGQQSNVERRATWQAGTSAANLEEQQRQKVARRIRLKVI